MYHKRFIVYCSKSDIHILFVRTGHIGFILISEFPVIIQLHNLLGLKLGIGINHFSTLLTKMTLNFTFDIEFDPGTHN